MIHDKRKSKLVTFKSSGDFNSRKVDFLTKALSDNDQYENYTNSDYDTICDAKVVTSKARKWKNYTYKTTTVVCDELSYNFQSEIASHE